MKASITKLHEEIASKDDQLISFEHAAENKIKLLKQKEKVLTLLKIIVFNIESYS